MLLLPLGGGIWTTESWYRLLSTAQRTQLRNPGAKLLVAYPAGGAVVARRHHRCHPSNRARTHDPGEPLALFSHSP